MTRSSTLDDLSHDAIISIRVDAVRAFAGI